MLVATICLITLDPAHSSGDEVACKGHTLKIDFFLVWANGSSRGKNGIMSLVPLLQTACFYLFMEILFSSHVLLSQCFPPCEGQKWGCSHSVMSKKTLEDHRALTA